MITSASGKFGGSYNYKGEWDVLDHIMVSKSMLEGSGFYAQTGSGKINSFGFSMF